MDAPFEITIQMVMTIIAGISAQVVADYLKVPSIVFLLLFGIVLGADGIGLLHPQVLGTGLEVIVALSVAVILFEGGLSLQLKELGKVSGSLQNLVTIGTLITLIGGGMAAHWLGEFPWSLAFLYAALVVVTGPTVVAPLLKQVKVDRQIATLLEGEAVLIDPVGAILAVVVLDVILNGDADFLSVVNGLILRLGIGVVIGMIGGWLLGFILKRANFLSEELRSLVVLAGLWGLFGLAQTIRSEAGLMATVVAGIVLRASSVPEERLIRRFKGQLTILAVSVLFILLAADLSIASIFALGRGAVFTVAVLMFVVRPLTVWTCTWTSTLNWRQKLFIAWVAPKGIVSASVASLFAILLTERGISGGDAIKALVFLTIISTVLLQGLTARWVAKLLRVNSTEVTGAIIVGCNPISRLIARLFQERGETVVLIDTDQEACREAERENLTVFARSALDTDVLEEAGLSTAGTFLAMTNNGEVNSVLAQRAAEEFQPPRVLAVVPGDGKTSNADPQPNKAGKANKSPNPTTNKTRVQTAFMEFMPFKTWNRYVDDDAVKLGETTLREPGLLFQQAHLRALTRSGELVPLLLDRQNQLQVIPASEEFQAGDRIIYLLHDPRPKLLKRLSGGTSPSRLAIEKLPAVEEIPMPIAAPEQESSSPAADLETPATPKADAAPNPSAPMSAEASASESVVTPPNPSTPSE
ncbi:MAG: cation:proton antiporter [Synechococcales cyanobacterium K44_A2020_017]|nr:cation:proton antiporter [Synechococcales cyanobacterium K32_A2020_035]MBF2094935.1 cation:proton antiporter [Synechococcales cyanobacterium K44_A2020_017]